MPARRGRVAVSITADNSGLKKGVKESEGQLGRLQRAGVSSTRGLSAGFKAAGGIIAGAAVADQIRQTVVAAQESEVSSKKMQAQLRALGISYRAHAKEIDNVIQKTSQLSGLDDEDLQDSFTAIVRATGNVKEGLRGTAIAADLARAKHMDVAKAGDLVAKVFSGNVGALKRMGIAITPVTAAQDKLKESTKHATVEQTRAAKEADKTATAQKALGELQKRVGGQAAAYGKTSAGAQDRFKVAVENLREAIGEKLLPIITKVTTKAADFVNQMTDGTGAGGRFAAKLKDIADRMKPIVKFFADHPKLIALAIGAWAAYRLAAAAAMAATRLKALGMFKGLAKPAAVAGAESGAAFGAASSASAGSTFARRAPGLFAAGKFGGAGRVIGGLLGTAIMAKVAADFDGPTWQKILRGILPFQPSPGGLPKKLPNVILGPHDPEPSGPKGPVSATGGPTPLKSKPSAGSQKAPDNRPRAHTSSARAHAAVASTRTSARAVAHAASGGGTYSPSQLASLWVSAGGDPASADVAAAVAMAESGGRSSAENHNTNGSIDRGLWQINSVHGALSTFDVRGNAKAAVSISGNGRNWSPWVTYQTGAYRQFLGRSGKVSAGSLTAGVSGGARAPAAPKRPKITTATLERGQSGVPNPTALGRKSPKTTGKLFMQALRPADPQAQAKNMRLFQIGMRRAYILDAIKSGRVKTAGTLQRLAAELTGLDDEQAELLGTNADKPTGTAAIPGADAYLSSLDRQAAEAALTPDTADDADVARRQLGAAQSIYDYERTHGFTDSDVAEAARNLKTARDAVDQPDQATTALADQMKALTDELKRQNDINEHILGVTSGQWQKAFADVLNGQIGGFIDSRARTAGDGSLARA